MRCQLLNRHKTDLFFHVYIFPFASLSAALRYAIPMPAIRVSSFRTSGSNSNLHQQNINYVKANRHEVLFNICCVLQRPTISLSIDPYFPEPKQPKPKCRSVFMAASVKWHQKMLSSEAIWSRCLLDCWPISRHNCTIEPS